MTGREANIFGGIGRMAAVGVPAAAGALAAVAWAVSRRITRPAPLETKFMTPWEVGIPHEEVSFTTPDGLVLRGWWLPNPRDERTIITLAGHNGARHHTLGIGGALWRDGANVLLFDNRGRGESDGHFTSLGYFETLDALAAVDYAAARSAAPVGIIGYSMGGSVAIMAAAQDARVGAVVADSPFASQRGLLRSLLRRRLPALPALTVSALVEAFLPYAVGEVEPIREVAGISPRACMFIHGDLDETTDPADSRALYEAAGEPKEIWQLEGVGHCDAYFADRARYAATVAAFFDRHLG